MQGKKETELENVFISNKVFIYVTPISRLDVESMNAVFFLS